MKLKKQSVDCSYQSAKAMVLREQAFWAKVTSTVLKRKERWYLGKAQRGVLEV
jgi:hypothetical protein